MPSIKYIINLTEADRKELSDILTKSQAQARTILRANVLLASDYNSKNYMTVAKTAEVYHTTTTTVQHIRASYVDGGLERTLNRKKRETPPVPAKVTGEVEAHMIALTCGTPPEGYEKWSLRLIAEECVELNYIRPVRKLSEIMLEVKDTTNKMMSISEMAQHRFFCLPNR